MTQVKVSEATNIQLDWMVANAEGLDYNRIDGSGWTTDCFTPSTDWSQGGPIIEREWLHVEPWPSASVEEHRWSCTQYDLPVPIGTLGPTPLIAAMRCYVASKLGSEVEVPDAVA
jgi:hypothetical protein